MLYIKSQASKHVLVEGVLDASGLYCFPQLPLEPTSSHNLNNNLSTSTGIKSYVVSHSAFHMSNNCNTRTLWHHRLCDANFTHVTHILKLCNIYIFNKQITDFCTSCSLGKSHRLHAPSTNTIYHKAFDMIYTNVWGPSPNPSSSGYGYYIAFVDGHTRYTWLYFHKQKSEALQAFKLFHLFFEIET